MRIEYMQKHIEQIERAKAEGIKVTGYFVYSFLDQFEWEKGYSQRYGLVYVDKDNKRYIKDSGFWYRDFIVDGIRKLRTSSSNKIETTSKPIDGVLLGDIPYSSDKMEEILDIILNGADIYVLGNNRIYKKDGRYKIDIGSWAKCLEYATRKKVTRNFGKPSKQIFEYAAKILNTNLHRCVVIGDDVEADVNGALKYGAKGILVQTGKFRENDMDLMKDGHKLCFSDIYEAMGYLKSVSLNSFFASKFF